KTPGHLMALDGVLETFPDAKIVMTHRDPVQTVPSYCSMMTTLYHMASTVDRERIGAFWEKRLAELLDLFMAVRSKAGPESFIDVRYTDTTTRPIEEGKRVLSEAGIEVTPEIVAGMAEWVEANKREGRAPHRYALEDFGLTREQVEHDFADYRAAFLNEKVPA
ncbi:MAG: sulfotransferase, partial [Stutzerimonas stutzeri]